MSSTTQRRQSARRSTKQRASLNQVTLRGRLADAPEARELPSGDQVVTFRLIVDRLGSRSSQVTVDTIDCTVWSPTLRRRVVAWDAGDILTVEGALRRRFWRSPDGARSRYDVEVVRVSRQRSE